MKTLVIIAILFAPLFLFAQKDNIPAFGKIDKEDIAMTSCPSDPDAEAYKLIDMGEVVYERGKDLFRMRCTRRIRIKILKEKGIGEANIHIHFVNKQGYEMITDVSANTYNLDEGGNIITTKLEKASIFTKKIDNRFSEVVFSFPQIKVGSVIEYRYTDLKESMENIKDWYFQDDIPTRYSQYKVTIPSMFRFVAEVLTYQKVEEKAEDINETMPTADGIYRYVSVEKSYTLKDIPALRDEPYMGSQMDYLERVQFQLSQFDAGNGNVINLRSSWPKLTEQLMEDEDFGLQLKKNIPKTQQLDDQLKGQTDAYKKMVIIHDYVRRNMNESDLVSIYTLDGIKAAWSKKSGTKSEINLILLNLLRSSDIECYPLLVSTRDHGSVNTFYPFLQQFNEVMAYVKLGDQFYVLDASDKYNPSQLIPFDVLNTQGFIVDKQQGGWAALKNSKRFNIVSNIFAEISADGVMEGEATVNAYDYAKNPRIKTWKEDRENFKKYFVIPNTSVVIDSIGVANTDDDTLAFEETVKFKTKLNTSGDYKYFTINLFNGMGKNPFIADERHTDVDFGYTQSYSVYGSIILPPGYVVDGLPKNISMITPDTSIILQRALQLDDNGLQIKLTVAFTKSLYLSNDYPTLKEFYKKLYGILNEQVVLKKATGK